ncbi:MAG: hypothetical protein ACM3OO_10980 [Planctomycetaceae bacterium]
MPRWGKVVVWTVVFAACAGAGAYVAGHTNPFPPGVEDPGARPAPTTTPTSTPTEPIGTRVAAGTLTARSMHRLHYGGVCRSDWRATWKVALGPGGTISNGEAIATLVPGTAGCDFTQAQVQTKRVDLTVSGTWSRGGADQLRVKLVFADPRVDPIGSQDLGGFLATLPEIRPEVTSAPARIHSTKPDGDEGSYVASYVVAFRPS